LVVGAVVTSPRAYAAEEDACSWTAIVGQTATAGLVPFCVFGKVVEAMPELDITRTAVNFFVSMINDAQCFVFFEKSCDEVTTEAINSFEAMRKNPHALNTLVGEGNKFGYTTEPGKGGRGNAGITGIAYKLGSAANSPDVIPLNLALYARDQVKNVPIIGNRVYAAEYGLIGENIVLEFWKLTRNIAYAMLSVVMIVIGAMIMIRRKINPQLVVSVESAIPKIVIAVILITFSYPIGATAAALLTPFANLAKDLLKQLYDAIGVTGVDYVSSISGLIVLIVTNVAAVFLALPIGALTIALYILVVVVWVIIGLIAIVKQIFIYVKILISIVAAPFTFALGAIPGNEDMVTNWFKIIAARIVGVAAMWTVFSMQAFVLAFMITNAGNGSGIWSGTGGDWQELLNYLLGPIISIMLLTASLSMPKKIEELFVGAPKKKG